MKEDLSKKIDVSGWDEGRILSKNTLTHWGRGEQVVVGSSYGNVTYRKWCELELKRINSKSKILSARIITRHGEGMDGWIALKR
jgi:hypothetical protein